MKIIMSIAILVVSLTACNAYAQYGGFKPPYGPDTTACKDARAASRKQPSNGDLKKVAVKCCTKASGGRITHRRAPVLTGNYVKVDDFNAFTGEEGDFGKLQTEVKRLATFHPDGTDMVTHEQLTSIILKMFFLLLGMVIVAGVMGFIAYKLYKMIKDNTEADARRDEELAKLAAAVIAKTDVEVNDLA